MAQVIGTIAGLFGILFLVGVLVLMIVIVRRKSF